MKNIIMLCILFVISSLLHATILPVGSPDSPYPSIMSAINTAVNGDTVLVAPGTYYENLIIREKTLVLASHYLLTADTTYINTTILDGHENGSVIHISQSNQSAIIGFTIQHGSGSPSLDFFPDELIFTDGGGIKADSCSQLLIQRNLIRYNHASNGGGIESGSSTGVLKGNCITMNSAPCACGGVNIWRQEDIIGNDCIVFDTVEKNSVYNNTSIRFNDIFVGNYDTYNIALAKGTYNYALSNNIILQNVNNDFVPINYTCDEAVVTEIASDFYVSVDGDDANSGTDPMHPLRSIFTASTRIQADSLNHHTIYVLPGEYGPADGIDQFPIQLKKFVSIKGYTTRFDFNGQHKTNLLGNWYDGYNHVENINIYNCMGNLCNVMDFCESDSIYLKNITYHCDENSHKTNCLVSASLGYGCYYEKIETYMQYQKGFGLGCAQFPPQTYKNIRTEKGMSGFVVGSSTTNRGGIISIANVLVSDVDDIVDNAWAGTVCLPFHLTYPKVKVYVSNVTVTGSRSDGSFQYTNSTDDTSYVKVYNSLFYGNTPNRLVHTVQYGHLNISYKNCLFQNGLNDLYLPDAAATDITTENILSGNPLFVGIGDNPCALDNHSPCIDAGTLDLPEELDMPDTDIIGNPRVSGAGIDIGAYEFNGTPTADETEVSELAEVSVYPNPMVYGSRAKTIGKFMVKINQEGKYDISIYNIKGQKVNTVFNGYQKKGSSCYYWSGENVDNSYVSTGVYFLKVTAGEYQKSYKFTIVK